VADGTVLSYPAGAPPGAPSTLQQGQVADLGVVEQDFVLESSREVAVATYQLGQTLVDPAVFGKGDPAQSTPAAIEQYRLEYVFLAPDDYDVSFADIVMPLGANVQVDGMPISVAPTPIDGEYGVARVELGVGSDGAHRLTSTLPVGLQVMGYGFATSYQYPGGLNLLGIAPPMPPIK